ncbi:hypothetical protein BN136_1284 [Cronobacter universalis NCTC 9529]|nr:hypothetical protein BN136_1284 [Cronobacter universalis NCTC 9529]
MRIKRQNTRAALQQRKPGEQRSLAVFRAQRHTVALAYALLMKTGGKGINTFAERAPGDIATGGAQRDSVRPHIRPVAPWPVKEAHNSGSSASTGQHGNGLSGHGRTS